MLIVNITSSKYSSLIFTAIISTVAALFSFILIYYLTNLSTLFFAHDFKIAASFNLTGVSFSNGFDYGWTKDIIVTILLSKPISALILGVVFLVALLVPVKKSASVVFLLFWMIVFSFNTVYGILLNGEILRIAKHEIVFLSNVSNFFFILISIIFAFVLLKIGIIIGKMMQLLFSNQYFTDYNNKILFFIFTMIIPWSVVVSYSLFTTGVAITLSGLLSYLSLLIFIIPFLMIKKNVNEKLSYYPVLKLNIADIIIIFFCIFISIIMVIILKNGVAIQ